ncbi:hypothetical protein DENSPDRAFT_930287 [Dentipellis sp. KUC8613]|nr:hypothetical protein DENSPDRAFT_930287 [Dentipellis sp. KUC8613]
MSSSTAIQSQPVASTSHIYLQPPPPVRLKSSPRPSRTLSSVQEQPVASTSRAVLPPPRPANSQQDTLQVPSVGHGRRRASPSRRDSSPRSARHEQQHVAYTSQTVITSTSAQGHADISSSPAPMKSSPPVALPTQTVSGSRPSSDDTPPPVTKPDSPTPSTYSAHLRTIAGLSDLITRWRGKAVPSVTKYSSDTAETHPSLRAFEGKASSTINEYTTFECEHAVTLAPLLKIVREDLLERARVLKSNVLVGERWTCTIHGPMPQKAGQRPCRLYSVKIHYSARPVATEKVNPWAIVQDPGCPINLERTDDVPAVMRIKSRSRKFLREVD